MHSQIEYSKQSFSSGTNKPEGGARSHPLHQLSEYAPVISDTSRPGSGLAFPFANDESARYFQQLLMRTETPDYQTAKNRVALLVGESALAASLPFIPEDTIILLDKKPHFCFYMQRYVRSLRNAPDPQSWQLSMVEELDPKKTDDPEASWIFGHDFERQIRQWKKNELPHALEDDAAYQISHNAAQEKAIIPWRSDIRSEHEMKRLGQALVRLDATITMANLTNVINWPNLGHYEPDPIYIEELPVARYAPILTTSTLARETIREASSITSDELEYLEPETFLVPATGPFFGLDNLFVNGGTGTIPGMVQKEAEAVFVRQYASLACVPEKVNS